VDVLQAFAEPRRRDILRLVHHTELTAGEIAARFDISGPAISQHLRVLRQTGLVRQRRDGTRRLYSARPEGLIALRAYVDQFWAESLEQLKGAVETDTGTTR
jgi:DNA-binding transcriptional ArsR family regulator